MMALEALVGPVARPRGWFRRSRDQLRRRSLAPGPGGPCLGLSLISGTGSRRGCFMANVGSTFPWCGVSAGVVALAGFPALPRPGVCLLGAVRFAGAMAT